ncbi:hypothetical protein FJZ18_03950 [Candidatus Pacearchaeota archaeon]|nr:hypothetical protein [Candidatus Pacearchaeota archaeon]
MNTLYSPQCNENRPAVIGFPGFVHSSEPTRIDNHLKKLSEYGILGIRLNYPGIELKNGSKLIECNYNLSNFVQHAQETFEMLQDMGVDTSRIGLLDSSIGSGIAGNWLARNTIWNPACKVSISPLPGWPYFASPHVRWSIEKSAVDVNISSSRDKLNGVKRVIKQASIENLIRTDALEALRNSQSRHKIPMMSVIGMKDEKVSPESMEAHHNYFADPDNSVKIMLPEPHDIPEEKYESEAIDFFKRYLLNF